MALKLLSYPSNKNAQKALIAAQFVGVEIEVPPFEFGKDNATPEFKKLTPIGKVPVLVTPKGVIFESNAIARYVARLGKNNLLPSDDFELAQVDQWIDFAANEIGAPLMKWAGPLVGYGEYKEEVAKQCRVDADRALAALEHVLSSSSDLRLVGKSTTLADVIMVCELVVPWQCILAEEIMKPYPHVAKYFGEMLQLPELGKVLGDLAQAMEVPTGPLPPEKNPFVKPKRSSETNGHPEENDAKKAKVGKS